MNPEFNKSNVAAEAEALLPQFREILRDVPAEAGFGGIWESEMFLFFAAVKWCAPRQILESGRARGKSTLILARCFPDAKIVSVELDRGTENAIAAENKLSGLPNVELLYGDSRTILPDRLQPGDAVLIDGPKDFRAVELAIEVLRTGKPCAVFAHDFPPGAPWRKFVERHFPNAFFGDDPLFEPFRVLDEGRDPRTAGAGDKTGRYGIFAGFPPGLPKPYWRLRLALMLAQAGL